MKNVDSNLGYPDWIDAERKKVHQAIFNQIEEFDKSVSTLVSSNSLKGLRQYTGRNIPSLHNINYMNDIDSNQLNATNSIFRVAFNLTASVIDTLTAKLASIESVPQAVTNKGNSKGRKLAEDLNHLIKGIFHKYQLSHQIQLAFRDAMINRAGYLKVIKDENDIQIDRVLVDEIVVDQADGYYNQPYKMIHRKSIPVHVLKKQYPKFTKEIEECTVNEVRQYNSRNYTPCITVAEAWCKNTYTPNGRHVICIETADILDESWDKDYLPIVKCEYNEPVVGWLGQSVVDELAPLQTEIDRILATMQSVLKIMSVPRVFVDTNSEVNSNHITNKLGLILKYDAKQGVAPIIHNGAAMPPELMQSVEFLINQAYARVGLTPMDTQGQQKTGSGNTSGEALKTMTDIKSERWQLLQHNFENKHVELASIILKELQGSKIKVSALDRNIGLREINTKVIPKVDDSYVLRMYPVSSLPDSIPDLIDSVSQMLQLGVIQPSQVPDLFNMPDIDSQICMQTAPRKLIDKRLEQMIDTDTYTNPEPYHDLDYAAVAAMQHYNWGQLNDMPDRTLGLLRQYINDVKILLAQRAPVAPLPQQQPVSNSQKPVQSQGVIK